ncbi:MAG: nitroreductase family protein [Deltaproteobacteria bacterium]|nr:nitroreductase family protein [Deltaproteobacteria bacterium]MBW1818534.1 nitroreductase family protein [Deltaproteobacteria bacterium]MBW2285244.1 nitroreductase family protein [Deltaproteobacteria bacterium]
MAFIMIDADKCNQDSLCIFECPAQVLQMDSETDLPVVTDDFEDVCLRCGHCVAVCPTAAFSLEWMPADACTPVESDLKLSSGQAEQFLRSRRSVRVFRDEPVDRAKLEKLIDIACYAPSAKNAQPWHWLVIEDPAQVWKLDGLIVDWMRSIIRADPAQAELLRLPRIVGMWEQGIYKTLRNAPHLFIVHVDETWPFGPEDSALALSYVELFSPTLGLGATWSGYFYRAYNSYPPMAEAVPVPPGQKVVGAMMVGRPKFKYQRLPNRNAPRIEWR